MTTERTPAASDGGRPAVGRPAHLPELDGLRGAAVLAVVAYHLGHLRGGFIGVDVFFVLSGFLITRLLIAEHERSGSISLRSFWGRRVRRLMPAMVITSIGVVIAGRRLLPAWRLGDLRADALSALGFVANWRLVLSGQSYVADTAGPSPLRHTWSLAVEEQYYLLWPLLVLVAVLLGRRHVRSSVRRLSIGVAIASATWMIVAASAGVGLDRLYYGTDSRVFAMAIGGIVATFFDPVRVRLEADPPHRWAVLGVLPVVAVVGIVIGFGVADEASTDMYRGGFLAITILTALFIVSLVRASPVVSRIFGSRPLVWLGVRSYGIYLLSWPVQRYLELARPSMHRGLRDLVVVLFTLVAASASYVLVERPVLERRLPRFARRGGAHTRPSRPVPAPAVASIALLAAALVWIGTTSAVPAPEIASIDEETFIEGSSTAEPFGDEEPLYADRGTSTSSTVSSGEAGSTGDSRPGSGIEPEPGGPFDPEAPVIVGDPHGFDPEVLNRPLRVAILGDSVAVSMVFEVAPHLPPWIDIRNGAVMGCSLMPIDGGVFLAGDVEYGYPNWCERQAGLEADMAELRPDVLLLWFGTWDIFDQFTGSGDRLDVGTDAYADALRGRIQARVDLAREREVGVVGFLVPCFDRDSEPRLATPRTPERIGWFNEQLLAVAEANPGWMRIVDPGDVLCPGGQPRREIDDGSPLRPDGTHFEPESAAWFWQNWLGPSLSIAFDPA